MGDVLGKALDNNTTGESWELSGIEGDVSVVSNGPLEGIALTTLISEDAVGLLGQSVLDRFGSEFPILIKFIDAQKDLSIQLHPNDELAQERHNSNGKTEMWYIMQADEDADLIIGFNKDVSREEYSEHLSKDSLTDLLHYEKVVEGDTFFINTGKIHAIGAGVLLAEIQQTSDITYRVYDFNRRDAKGALRELHTELALDAIDFDKKDDFKVVYSKETEKPNHMVHCPYFVTNYLELTANFTQDLSLQDSFVIFMCVEGEAKISNASGEALLSKGETVLISADTQFVNISTEGAKFLQVTL